DLLLQSQAFAEGRAAGGWVKRFKTEGAAPLAQAPVSLADGVSREVVEAALAALQAHEAAEQAAKAAKAGGRFAVEGFSHGRHPPLRHRGRLAVVAHPRGASSRVDAAGRGGPAGHLAGAARPAS